MIKVGDKVKVSPEFLEFLKKYQNTTYGEHDIYTVKSIGTDFVILDRKWWRQSDRLEDFDPKYNKFDDNFGCSCRPVFIVVGSSNVHAKINNNNRCSCDGPKQSVVLGIGPAAEVIVICSKCKKEK